MLSALSVVTPEAAVDGARWWIEVHRHQIAAVLHSTHNQRCTTAPLCNHPTSIDDPASRLVGCTGSQRGDINNQEAGWFIDGER